MRPYGEVAKKILLVIGVAGIVSVAVVAPGALLAAKPFVRDPYRFNKKQRKEKAIRTVRRLEKSNLIVAKRKNGKFVWELTKEGRQKFQEIRLRENLLAKLHIAKPPRWDGKWRVVIFDIPDQSHKQARDILRGKLKQWEFYPLQKSVWACPWPCENEIQTAAELYGVARYVNVIVAEKILSDASLREHFGF